MIAIGSGQVRTALARAPFARPRVPATPSGAASLSTTRTGGLPRYVFRTVAGLPRPVYATRPKP